MASFGEGVASPPGISLGTSGVVAGFKVSEPAIAALEPAAYDPATAADLLISIDFSRLLFNLIVSLFWISISICLYIRINSCSESFKFDK